MKEIKIRRKNKTMADFDRARTVYIKNDQKQYDLVGTVYLNNNEEHKNETVFSRLDDNQKKRSTKLY